MNIYSRFINSQYEHDNDKEIYNKAKLIIKQCSKIEKNVFGLRDLIQNLLNEIGGIDEQES